MNNILDCIEKGDIVNLIKYLQYSSDLTPQITSYASFYGRLDCLKYLIEIAKCPVSEDAFVSAAEKGNTKCLQYLFKTCPINTSRDCLDVSELITCYAAGNNHIDCLKIAIQNNCLVSQATLNVAVGECLVLLQNI